MDLAMDIDSEDPGPSPQVAEIVADAAEQDQSTLKRVRREMDSEQNDPLIISLFQTKGGVGKTTLSFYLAWALATGGKKVLMVDADGQQNLTQSTLNRLVEKGVGKENLSRSTLNRLLKESIAGDREISESDLKRLVDAMPDDEVRTKTKGNFDAFKEHHQLGSLFEAVEYIRETNSLPDKDVKTFEVKDKFDEQEDGKFKNGFKGELHLLHGHEDMGDWDGVISAAEATIRAFPTNKNIPGAPSHVIRAIAHKLKVDVVFIDLNPNMNSLNRCLWWGSDYFIVPCAADFHSHKAMLTLERRLPTWVKQMDDNIEFTKIASITPVVHTKPPKFIGNTVNRYRVSTFKTIQNGVMQDVIARSVEHYRDLVEADALNLAKKCLDPTSGLRAIATKHFDQVGIANRTLLRFPDIVSLGSLSQYWCIPVPYLSHERDHFGRPFKGKSFNDGLQVAHGAHLEGDKERGGRIRLIFNTATRNLWQLLCLDAGHKYVPLVLPSIPEIPDWYLASKKKKSRRMKRARTAPALEASEDLSSQSVSDFPEQPKAKRARKK